MFIIEIVYDVSPEETKGFLKDHEEYLLRYYSTNIFIASGRKVPAKGEIIIANGDSLEVMEHIVREDPFIANHIAHYRITEFVPSKYHGALEMLL